MKYVNLHTFLSVSFTYLHILCVSLFVKVPGMPELFRLPDPPASSLRKISSLITAISCLSPPQPFPQKHKKRPKDLKDRRIFFPSGS